MNVPSKIFIQKFVKNRLYHNKLNPYIYQSSSFTFMSSINRKRSRDESVEERKKLDLNECLHEFKNDNRSIPIRMPTHICGMSRTNELEWKYGDESAYGKLKLANVSLPYDLNEGFQEFAETFVPSKPDSLQHVLGCMETCNIKELPHVVSWRGILSKIMCTPYNRKERFQFTVWKYKNVLFLSNRELDEKVIEDMNMSPQMKRMMYYGYKFEEVCTRGAGDVQRANPKVCYCRLYKTKLGDFSLVGAAEMDCYDEKSHKDIELKVTKILEHDGHVRSFERFKLWKYYVQSFLAGVPEIVVGFRDEAGSVHKVQRFDTLKIPQMVSHGGQKPWDPKIAVKYLEKTIAWLYENVPNVDEDVNDSDIYVAMNHGNGIVTLTREPRTDDEIIDSKTYDFFTYPSSIK